MSTGGSRAQRRVCKFLTAGHISAFGRVLYTEDFQKRVGFVVFTKQFCHGNVCQEAVWYLGLQELQVGTDCPTSLVTNSCFSQSYQGHSSQVGLPTSPGCMVIVSSFPCPACILHRVAASPACLPSYELDCVCTCTTPLTRPPKVIASVSVTDRHPRLLLLRDVVLTVSGILHALVTCH